MERIPEHAVEQFAAELRPACEEELLLAGFKPGYAVPRLAWQLASYLTSHRLRELPLDSLCLSLSRQLLATLAHSASGSTPNGKKISLTPDPKQRTVHRVIC